MKQQLHFIRTLPLSAVLVIIFSCSASLADDFESSRRPNILVLMGDDWSAPHASCLGDTTVKTPTFDRIAREGVLFENAFVSAPSCTPSRLAIATGQYHWRLNEGVNLGGSIREGVPVYPELLQVEGYKIGFSRKGATPSQYEFTGRDPFGPRYQSFETFYAKRDKSEPFCFWYGAGEPHRPYIQGSGVESGMRLEDVQVPACLPNNETVRGDMCDYYLMIQKFDQFAAEMLAFLEANGELENTIIVMSGDNGLPFPRCKSTLYDTGTHVPLAIRWGDNISSGRTIEDFVSLCDLAPTFLEAAGLTPPSEMTGRSLTPLLTSTQSGRIDPTRDHVLTAIEQHVFPNPCRAIRTDDYLYIRNFEPETWRTGRGNGPPPSYDFTIRHWPSGGEAFSFNIDPSPSKQFLQHNEDDPSVAPYCDLAFGIRAEEELFDLQSDPEQLHNVASDPAYEEIRNQLRGRLESLLQESEDFRFP